MEGKVFFREKLYEWASANPRPLPWKQEKDVYRIWLSEIILQQTRVEQGLPYYLKFLETFPTVSDLAQAGEDAVFKCWEGLGYYVRARNLHAAAKKVAFEFGGVFPDTYEGLKSLPGVGPYTAAAIASFAYQLPYAVLDGNVYRVLARFKGVAEPVNTPKAQQLFGRLAADLLDPTDPARYNQALMDFGATHCTPVRPGCRTCPLQARCTAFLENRVSALPQKQPKAAKKNRYFLYAVCHRADGVFIRARREKDIWQGLFEFPLVEVPTPPKAPAESAVLLEAQWKLPPGCLQAVSPTYRQILTHQVVHAVFYTFALPPDWPAPPDWVWQEHLNLKKIVAMPRVTQRFLSEKPLTLGLI